MYPPKPVLDPSLLPPLEATLQEATKALMGNRAAQPMQQYLALWKEAKAAGAVPQITVDPDAITATTTLREILLRMERLGERKEAAPEPNKQFVRSLAGLDSRSLWVVPGEEAPSCQDIESGDDIERLASIKIVLE